METDNKTIEEKIDETINKLDELIEDRQQSIIKEVLNHGGIHPWLHNPDSSFKPSLMSSIQHITPRMAERADRAIKEDTFIKGLQDYKTKICGLRLETKIVVDIRFTVDTNLLVDDDFNLEQRIVAMRVKEQMERDMAEAFSILSDDITTGTASTANASGKAKLKHELDKTKVTIKRSKLIPKGEAFIYDMNMLHGIGGKLVVHNCEELEAVEYEWPPPNKEKEKENKEANLLFLPKT